MAENIGTVTKKVEDLKAARRCQICDEPTENTDHYICTDCRRSVLVLRTILAMMKKDGLCFLSGFGDVESEVKSVNV